MTPSLPDKVRSLPTEPGVYLFKDRRGKVIYVGKAASLRVRVRQYLAGSDERFMVPFLVRNATDVDVVITHTEKEALLLENTLIKKHKPRFNVKMRDDSNFLHLRIDPKGKWPRYHLRRSVGRKGTRTFGPYHSASRARETLAFLQRAFPLRTCTDAVLNSRKRPCLLHQMGRCCAPCVDLVTPAAYSELVDESMLMLDGKHRPLIKRLRARMTEAAEGLHFEQAAKLRDLIRTLESTLERQRVIDTKRADRDVWGLYREDTDGAVSMMPVRQGVMNQPHSRALGGLVGDDGECLSSVLNTAYPAGVDIPPEILVPALPPDHALLEEVLGERRGKRVVIRAPQRGDKVRLVAMATDNARLRFQQTNDAEERLAGGLAQLAKIVGLELPPHRIECFDNSNIGGDHAVAAMAVFIDGRPDRSEYRRYRVKTVVGADDYATMREIVDRRMRRGVKEGNLPDLLVVDGGKGQLGVALAVLKDLGLEDQKVIGISKPRTERKRGDRETSDKIVLPNVKDPIVLRYGNQALRILQHIRDEVHTHAIRYHRQVRSKNTITSVLESIAGVGPARRKALLRTLGSASAVAAASVGELGAVEGIGPAMAEQIWRAFRPGGEE